MNVTLETQPRGSWFQNLQEAMRASTGVAVGIWWNVVLLIGSVAALPFDRRSILGLNPWIKPIKFEISVIIFLATIALLLWSVDPIGRWRRSRAWLGWGFGICMIVENTIVAMQSARGVRSHMNFSTLEDGLLFATLGLFIALNTALVMVLLAMWCISRTGLERVVVWGVRLGLVMLLVASFEGVRIVTNGAHTVGAPDGLPGLPFVNWSRAHGDLRVAHFFALHCLQIFPLVGLALVKTRWRESLQLCALCSFAAAYAAGVSWLFVEAMRGVPLVR